MPTLVETCKAFVAESEAPHKAKGAILDPILQEAAGVLEPALAKAFPTIDTTEVQGIVHWALQLGIKLQSDFTI